MKFRFLREVGYVVGVWVIELFSVLWGFRIISNRFTGRFSFFFVYGAEVVFPSDLFYNVLRVEFFSEAEAEYVR